MSEEVKYISQYAGSKLFELIQTELAGKYAGIHAYDKYIWTIRSGFLTLLFGAWSLFVKQLLESSGLLISVLKSSIVILTILTITLALGAFFIDRNYCRRKFRIIYAVNELMRMFVKVKFDLHQEASFLQLSELLQISGDASNDNYKCVAYNNELNVGMIIYCLPAIISVTLCCSYLLCSIVIK